MSVRDALHGESMQRLLGRGPGGGEIPPGKFEFIWKTQHPAGCAHGHGESALQEEQGSSSTALRTPPDMHELSRTLACQGQPSFHNYGFFQLYDSIARRALSQARKSFVGTRFRALDLSPLYMRTDAHPGSFSGGPGDCLHLCVPGPLSLARNLLSHLLRE